VALSRNPVSFEAGITATPIGNLELRARGVRCLVAIDSGEIIETVRARRADAPRQGVAAALIDPDGSLLGAHCDSELTISLSGPLTAAES
jgi:hypothetical protein